MRNERFIYLFLVLICSFLLLFYFWGLRKEHLKVWEDKKSGETALGKLQAQIGRLSEIQDSLSKSEATLKEELKKEREKVLELDERLKVSVSQSRSLEAKIFHARTDRKAVEDLQKKMEELSLKNEVLKEELDEARKKFEMVEPVKNKLSGVAQALGALELKKGKDELLGVQLDSISQELTSVNNYMLQLLENDISPIRGKVYSAEKAASKNSQEPAGDISRYLQEIDRLKASLDAAEKQRSLAIQQSQDVRLKSEQDNKELNARAEKIFSLQEKVMAMENSLFEMRTQYKEMEKDAAVLREKYVAVELEKSSLQIALDQTRQEMGQLQNKFLSLLGRIGGIFNSSEDMHNLKDRQGPNRSKNSKIGVELIPQDVKEQRD